MTDLAAITGHILRALRSLPDAPRWRLIGWLAEGLEPTQEMRARSAVLVFQPGQEWTKCARDVLREALTAAREASDAG